MKALRIIGLLVVAVLMCCVFAACSKDDDSDDNGFNLSLLEGTWYLVAEEWYEPNPNYPEGYNPNRKCFDKTYTKEEEEKVWIFSKRSGNQFQFNRYWGEDDCWQTITVKNGFFIDKQEQGYEIISLTAGRVVFKFYDDNYKNPSEIGFYTFEK